MPIRFSNVTLFVWRSGVEIEDGVSLPPGRYQAVKKETGTGLPNGEITWSAAQYLFRLTVEEYAKLGGKQPKEDYEYDLAELVCSGEIDASEEPRPRVRYN